MKTLFDGLDKAIEEGFATYRERINKLPDLPHYRSSKIPRWNGKIAGGPPVHARVDYSVWLADCECGGAEFVTESDPIFFCFSCGNREFGGHARPVIFPKNVAAISDELEKRAMREFGGSTELQKARLSRPQEPYLSRSWNPGETVEDLASQRKASNKMSKKRN